jgi:SAM-dependent methyltransferase
MRLSHDVVERFACPRCAAPLVAGLIGNSVSQTTSEALSCTGCDAQYPIIDGVPRFVSSDNYAASFGMQWTRHPRTQLDSETGTSISRDRLLATTRWPSCLNGQTILEAGSGAGRFTEVLLTTGAFIYSFDFSAAVDANAANNGRSDSLCLFQASIFDLPLRKAAFDKVLCLGVLQHTPNPERAFQSLATFVRPGGELVVDVYPKRLTALISWKYLLRPITTRLDPQRLHRLVEASVDALLPVAIRLRRLAGRTGARLLPITEYSHLLPRELNREWAVLDTFDMYSPEHDRPQSIATVQRWFSDARFTKVQVGRGLNGVVGRGTRPA